MIFGGTKIIKQLVTPQNDLDTYIDLCQELCEKSGSIIMEYFRQPVEIIDKADKGPSVYSPVTEADRRAEEAIRNLIGEAFPEHGIRGEEYGDLNTGSRHVWVLDPIDGTKSFISGLPTWGTLIALLKDGKPILGAMNQPFVGDRFIGIQNLATLNDKKISTRPCNRLKDATLAVTDLGMFQTSEQLKAFNSIAPQVKNIRFGGDCYNYALLAAGHIDLVIEGSLMPWDIQALIPIIKGAGGHITDWSGKEIQDGGWVIAAGSSELHKVALDHLQGAIKA